MKSLKLMLSVLIFGIMMISLVSAWTGSTFNDSTTEGNHTSYWAGWPEGMSATTKYLKIPQNVYLSEAYINLTGYENSSLTSSADAFDESGSYTDSTECFDDDWGTYGYAQTAGQGTPQAYQRYYIDPNGTATWSIKWRMECANSGGCMVQEYLQCWDYDNGISQSLYINTSTTPGWDSGEVTTNLYFNQSEVPYGCIKYGILYGRVYNLVRGAGGLTSMVRYYEDSISHSTGGAYPFNARIFVGNANETQYENYTYLVNGTLGGDENKSSNLAFAINEYLNSCSYVGGYCYVPIKFTEGSIGILEFSDLIMSSGVQIIINASDTGESLMPSCTATGGTINSSLYLETTDEVANVTCILNNYNDKNFLVNASDGPEYFTTMNRAYLNLTFSENVTGEIEHDGGSVGFENVNNLYYNMSDFEEGYVIVSFNNGTQKYTFYNNLRTNYEDNIYVQTIDISRKIKVLGGSQEVAGARVILKKSVGGEYYIVYSEFTNSNGEALVLVDDTNNYRIIVEKEGYETYDELHYFAPSDTETIIVNLISEEDGEGEDFVTSGCPSIIGSERYCLFYVQTAQSGVIVGFNYTWNGSNYYVETESDNLVTLNLSATNTTTPITVNVYIDDEFIKTFTITYSQLEDRSIQLTFDSSEIKSAGTGPLILFYLIAVIIAILIIVSINRMPKAKGWGGLGAVIWFIVLAINGFPEFWFVALIPIIYYVFKALWSD